MLLADFAGMGLAVHKITNEPEEQALTSHLPWSG